MKIDWKKTNSEIAKEIGVSRETIRLRRIAEGVPPTPRGGRRPGAGAKPKGVEGKSLVVDDVPDDLKKEIIAAQREAGVTFREWMLEAIREKLGRNGS